jgi:hypothetical protein
MQIVLLAYLTDPMFEKCMWSVFSLTPNGDNVTIAAVLFKRYGRYLPYAYVYTAMMVYAYTVFTTYD